MAIFFQFFALQNVLKYLFYSVFEHHPKIAQKHGQKKTITFDIFQNTGW